MCARCKHLSALVAERQRIVESDPSQTFSPETQESLNAIRRTAWVVMATPIEILERYSPGSEEIVLSMLDRRLRLDKILRGLAPIECSDEQTSIRIDS